MGLRKGIKEAEQSAAKRRVTGTPTNWFSWKPDETKIIRWLTDSDQVATVEQHPNVPRHKGGRMGFICQKEFADTCELCESDDFKKTQESTYGIAVLRQETRQDGKIVGYEDVVEEVEFEENGQKVKKPVPVIGIVRQSWGNFWYYFKEKADKNGTLRDRDYEVKRQGSGMNDTKYISEGLSPQVEIPNIDERYAKYTPDLDGLLSRMASKEYYDRHIRGIEAEKKDGEESGAARSETTAEEDAAEFARLQEVADDIKAGETPGEKAAEDPKPEGETVAASSAPKEATYQ